ncbi:hypothetical protein IB234_20700 [Pseudomonas sp. PDM16]|uniref:hypothetical protein n=1 Tax=Pseudomonas sp. PDM16 TaxID=2769292 RepID=UPI0017800CE3|nr:hypothetical protein [Pseudomonas sp. PDM16]MBD9416992.1 hypothetical protein [Pseudomonas sp. PDM16]
MKNIAIKTICALVGIFGLVVLITIPALYLQGFYAPMGHEVAALKISSSVVRGAFLIVCALAAWRYNFRAAWLAWGAFAAFFIGGAADQVIKHGVVNGFENLIPAYYIASAVHALVAIALWLLLPKPDACSVRG